MRHTYSVFHEAHSGQCEENGVGSGTSISRFVGKLNMDVSKLISIVCLILMILTTLMTDHFTFKL